MTLAVAYKNENVYYLLADKRTSYDNGYYTDTKNKINDRFIPSYSVVGGKNVKIYYACSGNVGDIDDIIRVIEDISTLSTGEHSILNIIAEYIKNITDINYITSVIGLITEGDITQIFSIDSSGGICYHPEFHGIGSRFGIGVAFCLFAEAEEEEEIDKSIFMLTSQIDSTVSVGYDKVCVE